MIEMKCPFCQQELKITGEYSTRYCPRCIAERDWYAFGNETLWQELIHTRKALDIAVDALEEYENADSYDCDGNWCGCKYSTAHDALKQIRALEQKGTK